MRNEERYHNCMSYFPDGKPVPDLLTMEETFRFLRLDVDGPKHPDATLQYYKNEGLLRGTRVGKNVRYLRSELLRFLDQLTERRELA